jgi:hypothetical protein
MRHKGEGDEVGAPAAGVPVSNAVKPEEAVESGAGDCGGARQPCLSGNVGVVCQLEVAFWQPNPMLRTVVLEGLARCLAQNRV